MKKAKQCEYLKEGRKPMTAVMAEEWILSCSIHRRGKAVVGLGRWDLAD